MGNASSGGSTSSRDRHKSGESLASPGAINLKADGGQAFTFEHKRSATPINQTPKIILQNSNDDDNEPPYTFTNKNSNNIFDNSQGSVLQQSENQRKSNNNNESLGANSEEYPEGGRKRAQTVSEGTKVPSVDDDQEKILPTVFKWQGGGQQAYISGTFTEWKTIPMAKSHGDFVTIVDLPEGEHQYKFYIDGEWKTNPTEPTKDSDIGSKNNTITVKKTDFEVFDALDVDSILTEKVGQNVFSSEYGQDIPVYKPWEKTTGPPILPPHLLQVILNKDTPLSCEPTLLPEPNHVMLNHLYALSIRDGVMVLSATHRYRKKYVTSLLYKPI